MARPPLVDVGPELSTSQVERYSRHLLLPEVGREGQRRLANSRVLVVGAGGLGSPARLYLAAAGVGTLGVVDADVVEESNLQRQIIHGQSDIGRSKVRSAAESVHEVNPHVQVIEHELRLDSSNALELLRGYDLVVDGADNFATRYLVDDACALVGIPHVWGSIFRFQGQVSVWWAGEGPCYRCVFPTPPPPGSVPSCAEGGVLGVLCAAVAAVQAAEAIKLVVGMGDPVVGRLLLHDALSQRWDTLQVERNPDCPLCGDHPTITELIDYEQFCGLPATQEDDVHAMLPTVTAPELAQMLRERPDSFRLVDVSEIPQKRLGQPLRRLQCDVVPDAVEVHTRHSARGRLGQRG